MQPAFRPRVRVDELEAAGRRPLQVERQFESPPRAALGRRQEGDRADAPVHRAEVHPHPPRPAGGLVLEREPARPGRAGERRTRQRRAARAADVLEADRRRVLVVAVLDLASGGQGLRGPTGRRLGVARLGDGPRRPVLRVGGADLREVGEGLLARRGQGEELGRGRAGAGRRGGLEDLHAADVDAVLHAPRPVLEHHPDRVAGPAEGELAPPPFPARRVQRRRRLEVFPRGRLGEAVKLAAPVGAVIHTHLVRPAPSQPGGGVAFRLEDEPGDGRARQRRPCRRPGRRRSRRGRIPRPSAARRPATRRAGACPSRLRPRPCRGPCTGTAALGRPRNGRRAAPPAAASPPRAGAWLRVTGRARTAARRPSPRPRKSVRPREPARQAQWPGRLPPWRRPARRPSSGRTPPSRPRPPARPRRRRRGAAAGSGPASRPGLRAKACATPSSARSGSSARPGSHRPCRRPTRAGRRRPRRRRYPSAARRSAASCRRGSRPATRPAAACPRPAASATARPKRGRPPASRGPARGSRRPASGTARSGFFASILADHGRQPRSGASASDRGQARRRPSSGAAAASGVVFPSNGGLPVTSAKKVAPRL